MVFPNSNSLISQAMNSKVKSPLVCRVVMLSRTPSTTFIILTGGIPQAMGSLSNLEELYLGYNKLAGGIPKEMGNLGNLKNFSLISSGLSGPIPAEIFKISSLQKMYFQWIFANIFLISMGPILIGISSVVNFLQLCPYVESFCHYHCFTTNSRETYQEKLATYPSLNILISEGIASQVAFHLHLVISPRSWGISSTYNSWIFATTI